MAGAKTRFGFQGGSDPPDDDEPRAARTVYGHDIHLQLPPDSPLARAPGSPTPLPPPPAAAWPSVRTPGAATQAQPPRGSSTGRHRRPRPSRLARFLGRWTRSGRFEAQSRMRADVEDTAGDEIDIPRDTTGRNVLLVVLAALLAFSITFAAVRLRHRVAPAAPAPAVAQPVPAAPTAAVSSSPVSAPAVLAPAPAPAVPAVAVDPAAKGLGATAPSSRKPVPKAAYGAEPPAHLKGELLPIGP